MRAIGALVRDLGVGQRLGLGERRDVALLAVDGVRRRGRPEAQRPERERGGEAAAGPPARPRAHARHSSEPAVAGASSGTRRAALTDSDLPSWKNSSHVFGHHGRGAVAVADGERDVGADELVLLAALVSMTYGVPSVAASSAPART